MYSLEKEHHHVRDQHQPEVLAGTGLVEYQQPQVVPSNAAPVYG